MSAEPTASIRDLTDTLFEPGDKVVDVETGERGTVTERVTIGQLIAGRRPYPHVYDVAYDDGDKRRRMQYHLTAT